MRATSSASMPAGRMPYGRPTSMSASHSSTARSAVDPQLVAQVAGVAGPGHLDGDAADGGGPFAEVAKVGPVLAGGVLEDVAGPRALQRDRGGRLGDVLDRDVEPAGVHAGTTGAGGRRPSTGSVVVVEPGDRAVVDDLALLVAPARVPDLPDGELGRVPDLDAVDQAGGVGALDAYLNSGDTSISAAWLRIALYSMSQESRVGARRPVPDHSRHCSLRLSGAVRSWNAVPSLMVLATSPEGGGMFPQRTRR